MLTHGSEHLKESLSKIGIKLEANNSSKPSKGVISPKVVSAKSPEPKVS